MPAVNDAALPEGALDEAASGLAEVTNEFAAEVGGPPTLGELLEILGWAIPTNTETATEFVQPLPLRANLKGNRRYAPADGSRVAELNDNVFEEARDHLLTLFRRLSALADTAVTPDRFAAAVLQILNTGRVSLADIDGTDVRKITAEAPKKRATKVEIGDLVAIPVGAAGYRVAVVVARNRFGTALGLFDGVSPNGRLTAQLRAAPERYPVYTEDSLIRNGTWPVVGHDDHLRALFPDEPEIYHRPGAWPGIDTGEFGAAEPADGPLRLIDADEARAVGLLDGSYRQTYAAAFLQKRLTEQAAGTPS